MRRSAIFRFALILLALLAVSGCAEIASRQVSYRVYTPRIRPDPKTLMAADTSRPLSEWNAMPDSFQSLERCDAARQGLFDEARKQFVTFHQAHPATAPNTPEREQDINLAAMAVSLQSAQCIEDANACDRGLQSACIRYQAKLNGEQERRAAMAAATYQANEARQQQFMQNLQDQQMMQMQQLQPHYITRLPGTPLTPTYSVW